VQTADELGLSIFIDPEGRIRCQHEGVHRERERPGQRDEPDDGPSDEYLQWTDEFPQNTRTLCPRVRNSTSFSQCFATQKNRCIRLSNEEEEEEEEAEAEDDGVEDAHDPENPGPGYELGHQTANDGSKSRSEIWEERHHGERLPSIFLAVHVCHDWTIELRMSAGNTYNRAKRLTATPTLAPAPVINLPTLINPAFPPSGHTAFQTSYHALHTTHTRFLPHISLALAIKNGAKAMPRKYADMMICAVDALTARSNAVAGSEGVIMEADIMGVS
jgi:hypothetical protein